MKSISQRIAEELGVQERQVEAAVSLLDAGATVPFITRYRKEVTGTLDDTQLRTLEERLRYLRDLEDRRAAILGSIREQGKLDNALRQAIEAAESKARLEDIYLPYKPKRRTKAQIAREAGLEPLADFLLAHPERDPRQAAATFVSPEKVADVDAALDGARAILTERFAEDAELIGSLARRSGPGADCFRVSATARRRRVPSSPTISTTAKSSPSCPRIGSWRCSGARRRRCSTSSCDRKTRRRRQRPSRGLSSDRSPATSASPIAAGRATAG